MRAALLPLLPLLLLIVSPSSTLAAKRDLFTSDKDRKADDSTLPSKAQIRAAKKGCLLKFYPLNPKEPWPTTASPDHTYRLAVQVRNRNKAVGSDYKNVWLALFPPPVATLKPNSFRAKPALPDATLFPVSPSISFYGPFNVAPGKRQYIEFAYTLPVCSPGIVWQISINLAPTPQTNFTRVPPFPLANVPGTCGSGYDYRRKYFSKRNVTCV